MSGNTGGTTAKPPEKETEEEQCETCGWGPIKPTWCQRFRNPPCVLVWLCFAGAIQGMVVNGFVNVVISSVERRYELSSTESGFIASSYDVAVVLCLLPMTYFGGFGCKPRYLGIGLFIIGLGSFVFTIPHYIVGVYTPVTGDDSALCRSNSSLGQCTPTDSKLSDLKYFFYLGQFLHGIGATPLYTLGYTYLFENLPLRSSSLYFGIYTALAVVGPAIGYVAGGAFLNIYVDVNKIDVASHIIDSTSSRYIGAWWVGFLISGTLGVIVAIPLSGFPKRLPGSAKYETEREQDVYQRKDKTKTTTDKEETKTTSLKKIIKTAKVLFTNPTFIFITLFEAAEALLVGGFSTFSPKFIESQFSVSSSTAALYVGAVTIPAGGGGTLLGGYLIKRFNLRVRGILKMCIVAGLLCMVTFLVFAGVHCENVPFAGVNIKYEQFVHNSTKGFLGTFETGTCNANCNCGLENYKPICGIDGVTYYSPCHAGCNVEISGDKAKYHNCSCLNYYKSNTSSLEYTAEIDTCKSDCWYLPLFLPIFTVMVFLTFIPETMAIAATLRCLPQEERSIGMGVQSVIARCLGSIPGPVLFGKMIDLTCSLWQTKCDEQGSCFFYNNQNMSHYILAVALVCKTFALLFLFLSLCCHRTCPETSEDDDEVTSRTLTVSNDYVNKGFSDISDTNLENGSDKGSNVYYISSL